MPELARVTRDADLDSVVEILERDGGVIVEDFVDDETVAALWKDLGPALEAHDYGKDAFVGKQTRRVSSLFARTSHLSPVVLHPFTWEPHGGSCRSRCTPGSAGTVRWPRPASR
ncbi:hypothetical protein KGD82_07470 [Nocardiopsis eucommiae]|uniref:Phytanoyl-CoA dioxygenase family protein n=1 Tax=Nocardiopsis eucommiae TaxID=2831970 RepID=A0A975LC14_9ACTN|nr:hypothetical protein KGD82_07470 [Nocardiopsis eucommiae]